MSDLVWDDDAFKERVKAAADRKQMPMNQVLAAAGVSPSYLKKRVEGRSTNTVIKLARVLDVPAAEMFGLTPGPQTSAQPAPSRSMPIDGERLRRITMMAQIIAAQLAAMTYIAGDRSDIDPAALIEVVLREIHKTSERGGNNK